MRRVPMKPMRTILLIVLIGSGAAMSASGAEQGAELRLQGSGPYFTVEIPIALRSRAATTDLRDVHVVNSRNEPLPFAWLDAMPGVSELHEQPVPIFQVPGPASGAKPTPPRSWILDARAVKGSMLDLELVLADSARGVFGVMVETSADIQHWYRVQSSAQIVSLEHQGQRLSSTRIDLAGTAGGYLRLTALPGSLLIPLQSASASSIDEQPGARPMQWSDATSPTGCRASDCDYALPKNVPLEELQWQLPEPNALARVSLLGSLDQDVPAEVHEWHRKHHHHHPLRALRHKSAAPATTSGTAWMDLGTDDVYWLKLPEGEVRSAPTVVNGGFYSVLRVQTPGPITQLGAQPPRLRIGARARIAVFLARGPAPYRMLWGDAKASSTAVSLAQLMPARKRGGPLPSDTAFPLLEVTLPVAASSPAPQQPAAVPRTNPVGLWAALLAGLAAMAVMAWTLLRGKPTGAVVHTPNGGSTTPE
jgi:hypothetical protein